MYVYILKSRVTPSKYYVGITDDIEVRLEEHNSGQTFSTRDNRPWKMDVYFWFDNPLAAARFEKYLKTGSGIEFSKRHFR
ncbi:MAG: GIY-YIG nuclease family protein [Myxococcota bacterium]|nr:GIY-YIG nuclease family protein [Myxococcota bacterium]